MARVLSTMPSQTRPAQTSADDRIVFFFLRYDDAGSLQAETIIRLIIRQSIDSLSVDIENKLRELDRKLFVELRDWIDLLRQRIERTSTFHIFLDGVDECDPVERRALLDRFSSLATASSGLRVFIASRESLSVDLRGRFSRMEHVSMASPGLDSDIRLYVEAALQERIQNEDLVVGDPCLLNEIKDILKSARGQG